MEEMMLRDRTDRARRPGPAEFTDLEDIVVEVLASLDREDSTGDEESTALRRAIEKRARPQRRTSAVPERRQPAEAVEDGMVSASSAAKDGDEHAVADRPDPPADPELRMGELYSRGGGEALAIAAEDADFVRQAAEWLATRPNAEQLLDRVWGKVIECRSGPQHFGEGDPDASRSSPEGEKGG
jgi:hypothetical protein